MAKFNNLRTFDYSDVRLLPKECIVTSRSEVDVTTTFGNHSFNLPVVPANMSTIINDDLAIELGKRGYFYVMHRFDNSPTELIRKATENNVYSSISVGVKAIDYSNILDVIASGLKPDYVTVDIAHGHAESVFNMIKYLKKHFPETYVIAGNVGTVEGAIYLENAGADAVKVGIGPGKVCTTAPNTGFGTRDWQLSALEQIANSVNNAEIIADGGIRTTGDIAKSIAFGADMVMIGGMFAGHDENPGDFVVGDDGKSYKIFYGSASEHQKGEKKHVEGKSTLIEYKGSIWDTLNSIQENLQSSVSYAGGKNLADLNNVEYVLI